MSETAATAPDHRDEATTPLDVDGVSAITLGTIVSALLLIACLLLRSQLEAQGRGWWWGVCLAGALLGIPGLWFVRRRRAIYRRHVAQQRG